jgi:hypothetical protein
MLALRLPFLKLPVKSTDARLMKAEHNQSCGLPFIDARKNSPRLFTPKKVPSDWASPGQRCRAAIKAVGKYGQVIPLSSGRKQIQR